MTASDRPCVAGLDPSLTSFGVATWARDDEKPETWAVKTNYNGTSPADRTKRYGDLLSRVYDKLDVWEPSIIVIEGYAFGAVVKDRDGKQIVQKGHYDRAELRGILNADLLTMNCVDRVIEVNPMTLKAFIFKGNAAKGEIVDRVYSEWGCNCGTTDEADAVGCAKMARIVAGWDEAADDRQQAAMEAMLKP